MGQPPISHDGLDTIDSDCWGYIWNTLRQAVVPSQQAFCYRLAAVHVPGTPQVFSREQRLSGRTTRAVFASVCDNCSAKQAFEKCLRKTRTNARVEAELRSWSFSQMTLPTPAPLLKARFDALCSAE
eukprot:COSAG01_NODE_7558_length_3150_cov_3.446411_1_plen_126_part_10